MKKITCIISFLLLIVFSLQAQESAWADLKSICEEYRMKESIHYEAVMRMYMSTQPLKQIDQLQVKCEIEKDLYYSRVGPIEVLKNSSYSLMVDHDDKLIVVSTGSESGKADFRTKLMDVGQLLDAMNGTGMRIQKVMRGNETWIELSQLADDNIKQCNIQYDPVRFSIKRIWMKATDPSEGVQDPFVVDIVYKYKNGLADTGVFSERKFVTIRGKSAVLQSAYQNYFLINQL